MSPPVSPTDLADKLHSIVHDTYGDRTPTPHEVYSARHLISDLCLRLLRSVQGPEEYTAILAESCQESSALNLITSLQVADHIAESPNERLSLKELSDITHADAQYLSVALSSLLYHGYFEQVEEDVFANNEFSTVLRDGSKLQGAKSMKDAVGLAADDGARATTRLLEAATQTASPGKPPSKLTALNFAYNTDVPLFKWMASPGNEWRGQRTGKAMVQLHGMANGGTAEDYPWESLPTPIIDVGGGIGSFEGMLLSVPKNQGLDFIVFDIEATIENAKKAWSSKPQSMQDRVSFISGDFMAESLLESKIPRAADGAGTYVIRHVLHDWDDEQAVKILRNVVKAMVDGVDAAKPRPKLLLVEMLLTPNSSRFTRTTSLQLLSLSGGITRTEKHMRDIVDRVGQVKVERVGTVRGVDLILEIGLTD